MIHTVGPVWAGGEEGEDDLLASCYQTCLDVAKSHGIRSMAFPSISTGAYGFPMERAARIALREIRKYLETNNSVEKVLLVCYGSRAHALYEQAAAT